MRARNEHGEPFERTAEDLLAVCIQHEMDHLVGKMFVDYLSPLKRARLKSQAAQEAAARGLTASPPRRTRMRVGFAGTPDFAARRSRRSWRPGFDVPLVLTQPDRPKGRGLARRRRRRSSGWRRPAGLPVLQPATLKTDEARAPLLAVPLDVLVVAAYGLILPPAVLAWPRHGCLNIHASLLPRWRGAAPIQRAIDAGDAATGVTIMQMDAGLDTGADDRTRRRARSRRARRPARCTTSSPRRARGRSWRVLTRLARDGALAGDAAAGRRARPTPARSSARDAAIDWSRPSAAIDRQVRAFDPVPGAATCASAAHGVKVWRAEPVAAARGAAAGHRPRRRQRMASTSPAARARCGSAKLQPAERQADVGGGVCRRTRRRAGRALRRAARPDSGAAMQIEQQQAARAVRHVLDGMALPAALAAVDDGAATRGRALVQELAYGTLRHWGRSMR